MEPMRYHVIKKRAMYFHHLLTDGVNKLAGIVMKEQMISPLKGDLAQICLKDLKELDLDVDKIKLMTRIQFRTQLKESISKAALLFLRTKKDQQSKGKEVLYHKLEVQLYLRPESKLSLTTMRRIFQLRSRNLPIKRNFPRKYSNLKCVVSECKKEDSQPELFRCPYLEPKQPIISQNGLEYEDLFSDSIEKQVLVTRILYGKFESRTRYLASSEEAPEGSRSYLGSRIQPDKDT